VVPSGVANESVARVPSVLRKIRSTSLAASRTPNSSGAVWARFARRLASSASRPAAVVASCGRIRPSLHGASRTAHANDLRVNVRPGPANVW